MLDNWQQLEAGLRPGFEQFSLALHDARGAQERLLQQILSENKSSQIGRRFEFDRLSSYAEFARAMPITTYDSIERSVEELLAGVPSLTSETVMFVEETSGNTGGKKSIPFTAAKLLSFQAALHAWLYDLLSSYPKIRNGRMYWAISPAVRSPTAAKIRVGIENDALYFGAAARSIEKLLVGAHSALDRIPTLADWRMQTIVELLRAEDLAVISVWSPTFILELLRFLKENSAAICRALRAHSISRSQLVQEAVCNGAIDTEMLWPDLTLISCWGDAGARRFVPELRKFFPACDFQAKGLLATEGVVTIPWHAAQGCVPAVTSSVLEFMAEDGAIRLCDELSVGARYRVILTSFGGLYRYDLGDYVEVTKCYGKLPLLEFVGRGSLISDLCGEKLSESFVESCLSGIQGFAMLAPDGEARQYALIVDAELVSEAQMTGVISEVEKRLCANPHYHYARAIGQLHSPRGVRVCNPIARHEDLRCGQGQRLGSVKPLALSNEQSWVQRFSA